MINGGPRRRNRTGVSGGDLRVLATLFFAAMIVAVVALSTLPAHSGCPANTRKVPYHGAYYCEEKR